MTTPKEALELKPCPFCGGQAIKDTSGEFRHHGINYPVHRIRCDKSDCLAMPRVKNPIEGACIDAWNTRATASFEGDAVERVARIIDPRAFENWQGLYDYCKDNDEEFRRRCADYFHKADCDEARTKARAILAAGPVPDEAAIRADEREKIKDLSCESLLVMSDGYLNNPADDNVRVALSNAAVLIFGKERALRIRAAIRSGGGE